MMGTALYQVLKKATLGTKYLKYGRETIAELFSDCLEDLGNEVHILDIGCAHCDDLLTLRRAAGGDIKVHLHGLDFRERGHYRVPDDVDFKTGNAEKEPLPFEDGSMDFVVCNQIFEHCKEIFFMTSEISRVLKKGGYAVIGVPNLASLHARLMVLFGRQPSPIFVVGPHVRGFCPNGLLDLLEVGGVFKVKAIKGSGFYPFPVPVAKMLSRILPTFSISIFALSKKVGDTPAYFAQLRKKGVESSYKGWTD